MAATYNRETHISLPAFCPTYQEVVTVSCHVTSRHVIWTNFLPLMLRPTVRVTDCKAYQRIHTNWKLLYPQTVSLLTEVGMYEYVMITVMILLTAFLMWFATTFIPVQLEILRVLYVLTQAKNAVWASPVPPVTYCSCKDRAVIYQWPHELLALPSGNVH
jgi:hypothetical protein